MNVAQRIIANPILDRIRGNLGIFCILFLISCISYHFYLTNEFTPGGDGTRIYPYLKYMEKVPEIFPFWQGHKNHGYPLLADPENHMPWNLVLNTASPYFNIQLNFVFFSLAAIFAFTCRSIARMLGMSQLASLAVGVSTIVCVPLVRQFMHGSLSSMLNREIVFLSILLLLVIIKRCRDNYIYLIIPLMLLLSWVIRNGYYLPLNFHIPALVIVICFYLNHNFSIFDASIKSFMVVVTISFLFVFASMHFLLPILDGIALSKTFSHETPTIAISGDIYDYTFSLWPFMLLAVIFCKGTSRKQALMFLLMGSVHFILIALYLNEVNVFFELWADTPILRNIRWQHPFRELSSISSAFCAGLFLDSCRKNENLKIIIKYRYFSLLLLSGLIYILFYQILIKDYLLMGLITILFSLSILFYRQRSWVACIFAIIISIMVVNLDKQKSPFTQTIYKSFNKKEEFESNKYLWWRGTGYDTFSPVFKQNAYSLIFMKEYRTLLSLLYRKDIIVQRTNWVNTRENGKAILLDPKISDLMAIHRPDVKINSYNPFPVYDNWVFANDKHAVEMMRSQDFSIHGPIILDANPTFDRSGNNELKSSAILTGKTAETLSLHVETNKNSIVLIPEIYHRDWIAKVDGKKVDIIKAFASMRAIPLTPGIHDVKLYFVYKAFWIGVLITSVWMAFVLFIIIRYRNLIAIKLATE